ncbi:hypothetical protein K1F84_002025, partial [Campylobacter coli]|nr:hypothetical protein [Campylobacter coli]
MKQVDSIDSDLSRYEIECDNAFKKKCEDNAENILDELKESLEYALFILNRNDSEDCSILTEYFNY